MTISINLRNYKPWGIQESWLSKLGKKNYFDIYWIINVIRTMRFFSSCISEGRVIRNFLREKRNLFAQDFGIEWELVTDLFVSFVRGKRNEFALRNYAYFGSSIRTIC